MYSCSDSEDEDAVSSWKKKEAERQKEIEKKRKEEMERYTVENELFFSSIFLVKIDVCQMADL